MLIIVEKPSQKKDLEIAIKNNPKLKDYLGDYDIFSYCYNPEVFKLTEKKNNKDYYISHDHHELGAINISNNYFPFNPCLFNYKIENSEQYDVLKNLINKHNEIINACDNDRLGNIKFSSLVFSGYFDLLNKKIYSLELNSLCEKDISYSFYHKISYDNHLVKLSKQTNISQHGLSYEIAFNEFDWGNINLDSVYLLNNDILEKYSKKYNLDLINGDYDLFFKTKGKKGYLTKKQVLDLLLSNAIDKKLLYNKLKKELKFENLVVGMLVELIDNKGSCFLSGMVTDYNNNHEKKEYSIVGINKGIEAETSIEVNNINDYKIYQGKLDSLSDFKKYKKFLFKTTGYKFKEIQKYFGLKLRDILELE